MEIKKLEGQISFVSYDSLQIKPESDFARIHEQFESYVPNGKNYVFVGSDQEKDEKIGLGYRCIDIKTDDGSFNGVGNIKKEKPSSIDALVLSTAFFNPGENHADFLNEAKQKLVPNGLIKIENASLFFSSENLDARKQLFNEFAENGFSVWVLPKGESVRGFDEAFNHQAVTVFAQKL